MAGSSAPISRRDCVNCELRSLRMFCNLNDAALAEFQHLGTQRSLARGDTIFREEDSSGSVFILCTGQVKLACSSREGKTLILKIAMPGDVLGLSAAISGAKYEVTADAVEPVEIKEIQRKEFLAFLQRHGQASLHAAKALAEEYKSAFFDARRLALSGSAASRLASLLLDWGRLSSCGRAEMSFKLALTHEELANMVGSSRETVTRILSRFKKDKFISIRGTTVVVQSPKALEDLSA